MMKRFLSAALAIVMLLSSMALGVFSQEFIYDKSFVLGDADRSNSNINALDLFYVKLYLMGKDGVEGGLDTSAADLLADGVINSSDVFYYKSVIVSKIDISSLENGFQIEKVTIAGNDINEYTIFFPQGDGPDQNTYYSADQLQRYIYRTTGNYLGMEEEGTSTGRAIRYHSVDINSELGRELGVEGYKYYVDENGDLNIYGTLRGNLYATYEILENYFGMRYFDHEYSFFYKQRVVDIPADLERVYVPTVKFRYAGQNVKQGPDTYYIPARQNGMQLYSHSGERYGYLYGPQGINAHSFALYWQYGTGVLPEDDGTLTAEERYVACLESGQVQDDLGWQPCGTNGKDYDTLVLGMFRYMERIEASGSLDYDFTTTAKHLVELGQKTISFSLNDNAFYCSCRNCRNMANGYTDRKTGIYYPPEGYSGVYLNMANMAVNELQDKYPGMRVHLILYDQTVPATIRPDKNIVLMCCGISCNNHRLDDPNCPGNGQLNKTSNVETKAKIKAWGDMCAESGAELWFWHYAVTYHHYLVSMPCVFNIYWDYKTLFEECNVQGIYYEGGESPYNYGTLKAYLSTKMTWNPQMTFDEYVAYAKEYLYMYYGAGYEKIFEFIKMEDEASDQCGCCYISNFDRPGDMYSYAYFAENYEYMRTLLTDAYDMAGREEYKKRIETMIICLDFMGLSSLHTDWYVNGDEASRALYEERYTYFYNGLIENNMEVFSSPGIAGKFKVPDECVFDVNPMTQIYDKGSRREGVYP